MAVLVVAAAAGCSGGEEPVRAGLEPDGAVCWTLARVPGPEDLVVDRSGLPAAPAEAGDVPEVAPEGGFGPRLLVSSTDRRDPEEPDGAIWAVSLEPGPRARPLPLAGRPDGCSFRPHGLDLVRSAATGRTLLYVVNHHRKEDGEPGRGCFATDGDGPNGAVTSVEVFAVLPDRLRFVQRLADPQVVPNGNDLVALADGDVWMTAPPAGGLGQAAESLGLGAYSSIVYLDCARRAGDDLCTGGWRAAEIAEDSVPRYANGIAYRRAGAGGGGEQLVVAAGVGEAVHVFAIDRSGAAPRLVPETTIPLCASDDDCAHPDNFVWSERGTLLTAAHPDLRRFVQHARSPRVTAPTEVWEIDLEGAGAVRRLADPEGTLVSAASTAIEVDGDLVLGQVFEPAVLRCRGPGSEATR